ncbi:putative quinol monooxygenase [Roseateles amylovorans]|uniref:Antibiotic biosynthesis monooxygenase n=1 Tax=Roseateles amylovorans TaxID=2978473 RepID=A0ABY6B604_9BURK|nr:putative quinol monooxygenase [Roseateles amylovorans]UXH78665.1 antibiotic biosynthesis monooxygenase [Roseateles amylovorans]
MNTRIPAAPPATALTMIAVLIARPGQRDALRQALTALIEPTHAEPGCLDYRLFELADEPGTFYMRESFADQAALDTHFATPHFQSFAARIDTLMVEPPRLVKLTPVG